MGDGAGAKPGTKRPEAFHAADRRRGHPRRSARVHAAETLEPRFLVLLILITFALRKRLPAVSPSLASAWGARPRRRRNNPPADDCKRQAGVSARRVRC